MIEEDRPSAPALVPLEGLSIDDLEARVARLKQEIDQCQAVIEAKRRHRAAADALFNRTAT